MPCIESRGEQSRKHEGFSATGEVIIYIQPQVPPLERVQYYGTSVSKPISLTKKKEAAVTGNGTVSDKEYVCNTVLFRLLVNLSLNVR